MRDRTRASLRAGRDAWRGELPPRYRDDWLQPFRARTEAISSRSGATVLDVGSGRRPSIPPGERASDCHYVGLDALSEELELAPPGSYSETVEADAGVFVPELENRFDLIVSWQVLEHVKSLPAVLDCMRRYLKPDGRLVAGLSGRYSLFGIANRAIPHTVARRLVAWKTGRPADSVFPAPYDRCYHDALVAALDSWSSAEVIPRYRGANYFDFARPVEAAYVAYEEWAVQSGRRNLATHYLVSATR